MKFNLKQEQLLKPLQVVMGVVERKQTLPILSHVLIELDESKLLLTGTDSEVEIIADTESVQIESKGAVAVPGQKLLDICRSLAEGSSLCFELEENQLKLRAGRGRYCLNTLPAEDYPKTASEPALIELTLKQGLLKQFIEKTHFSMAQQDVRYYLNGMLWSLSSDQFNVAAMDGHRMAFATKAVDLGEVPAQQVIVPRKAISELSRLLDSQESELSVAICANYIQMKTDAITFTSKLIDGKFPDYRLILKQKGSSQFTADRQQLRQILSRVAVLSNDQLHSVKLSLSENLLVVSAHNAQQEMSQDEMEVDYQGHELHLGFNVHYLLDILGVISEPTIQFTFQDSKNGVLIESPDNQDALYFVMPLVY